MNVRNLWTGEERPEVMESPEQAVMDMDTAHPDLTAREVDAAFGDWSRTTARRSGGWNRSTA